MAETTKRFPWRPKNSKTRRHTDGVFKKCRHRAWSKCGCSWHLRFKFAGQPHYYSLNKWGKKPSGYAMSQSEAERLRDVLRGLIRDGHAPGSRPEPTLTADGTKLTLREVADKYHEHASLDPKRRPHRLPILQKALDVICRTEVDGEPFGNKVFDSIRTLDLEKFRTARRARFRVTEAQLDERRAKIAAGEEEARALPVPAELPHAQRGEIGIARSLELLRHVFQWGIEHDYRTSESPFRKFGQPHFKIAKGEGRHRRLQGDEEQRLLNAAPPHLRVLITVALETGMRREETLSLKWSDIECDGKGQPCLIHLKRENTKTDKTRSIPVSFKLRAVLAMRRVGPDGKELEPDAFVFGSETGTERQDSVKSAWQRTLRDASITNLHFHDLRHEAASRWLQSGRFTLLDIKELLGHQDVETTSIYLNAREGDVVKAMQRFNQLQRQSARAATTRTARALPARVH